MEINQCFKIGYVSKSHGLKGEVTIVLGPECPDLQSIKSLLVQINHQLVPHFVKSISVRGHKAFLKLEDVDSPEQALALKGSSLFLPKGDRPKLVQGEFYSDEVIGFEVIDSEKGPLGLIGDVVESGPNRYLMLLSSCEVSNPSSRQPTVISSHLITPFM